MAKAVVLLSGGLDSAFNLYKAHQEGVTLSLVLTVHYGQKAARREIDSAAKLCAHLGIPHQVLDLPWIRMFTTTSLIGEGAPPRGKEVAIDDHARSLDTAKTVWIPNRNGILLNLAAGFAEGLKADYVIPGFNIEEAATFPDNTADFLTALEAAWKYSTATHVRTLCYSLKMNKSEIVAEGLKLKLPFQDLWPCYLAGEKWCGECESCQRFQRALRANGVYAV